MLLPDDPNLIGLEGPEEAEADPEAPALPRNCNTCANYHTCEVRLVTPRYAVDAQTNTPFAHPKGVLPPMPCGGNAYARGVPIPLTERLKPAGMTWREWYPYRYGRPMRTERPQDQDTSLTELPQ